MGNVNNQKKIKIPSKSEKLAELIGIILGDGSLSTSRKSNYMLRISGNSEKDLEYLRSYVSPLIEELFGLISGFNFYKNSKHVHLYCNSKELLFCLEKFGLKIGNKKENNVSIPNWIFTKKSYMVACIRGLIDTDGCLYDCGNGSLFPRVNYCSYIENLQTDFRRILISLNYHPTPWIGTNIMIYRKQDIKRYIKEIGFSNKRNLNKLNEFAPVV